MCMLLYMELCVGLPVEPINGKGLPVIGYLLAMHNTLCNYMHCIYVINYIVANHRMIIHTVGIQPSEVYCREL